MSDTKAPSTLGEWDQAIAATDTDDLIRYRKALDTLQGWEPFNKAFSWTRCFVLEQSIGFALERRKQK